MTEVPPRVHVGDLDPEDTAGPGHEGDLTEIGGEVLSSSCTFQEARSNH